MMKWRVRRDSNCNSIEHEDIRRSLEVLDSVLAEFDDCLESWDTKPTEFHRSCGFSVESRRKFNGEELNGNRLYESLPSEDQLFNQSNPKDGSTIHNFHGCLVEQARVGSPPPVPKRSPTTRLSEYNSSSFVFPTENLPKTSEFSSQGTRDLSQPPTPVAEQIRPILSTFKVNDDNDNHRDCCSNCGRRLSCFPSQVMESPEDAPFSFQKRMQVFESKITDVSSSSGSHPSPLLSSPSFRGRNKTPNSEEPTSLTTNLSTESGIDNDSGSFEDVSSDKHNFPNNSNGNTKETTEDSHVHEVLQHNPNCHCQEKLRRLSLKFSETKRLIKLNKIKGLNARPPNFVPPLPPPINGTGHQNDGNISGLSSGRARESKLLMNGHSTDTSNDNLGDSSPHSKLSLNASVDSSLDGKSRSKLNWTGSLDSLRLCNRCSSHLSGTIEDLPHLLPTDALNRPQLGLSYSLEDDLSPGVKEIRQMVATSTPKSDHSSSPSSFRYREESGLSTFSQSASSLGYVSSQSDWELNHLPTVPDKVPVSTFRSRTLPNGLDRSPFYSASEEYEPSGETPRDGSTVGAQNTRTQPLPDEDLQLRSSSAPPPPEVEKPKKHFRVFSRKGKKDKNKNGAIP